MVRNFRQIIRSHINVMWLFLFKISSGYETKLGLLITVSFKKYNIFIRVDTDKRKGYFMDDTNKDILRLLRDNGRMSFTEIGERLGISRVAVKKRVTKLEEAGVLRGYKAVIYREGAVKMFMEITTVDSDYEDLLKYLNRTGYVTELYVMTGENRIHATAVAPDVSELKYLTKMVGKKFADVIKSIETHAVKEVVKDAFGGVDYDSAKRRCSKGNE